MTLLLALVASLALVRVGGGWTGRDTTVIESGAGRSQTIPGHVVGTAAAVALDGRERRGVQTASRRGDTRRKSTNIALSAVTRNVAKASASIALLVASKTVLLLLLLLSDPQAGALRLDMADTAAGVALLGSGGPGRGAGRRLVAGLAAVVAQPLIGRAILRNVAQVTTLETSLPGKLERHFFRLLLFLFGLKHRSLCTLFTCSSHY